jgi:choline dehydrogenase-like flavoprotein
MNVNHEYWHLRENDPDWVPPAHEEKPPPSRVEIKFSFGNCLYGDNAVEPAIRPLDYVPEITFRNLKWMDHLAGSRFPALAGWRKNFGEIFAVLNDVTYKIFSQFQRDGREARPENETWYGQNGKGFGFGTVHHAACTLRMPHRWTYDGPFQDGSVVDEDLQVVGRKGLYVCDMSVMPFSSAANPVRTLVALALRLSNHLG